MIGNRIEFLDIAKGIAILLVVMGHLLQFNMEGSSSTAVYNFIYSFHMPLFFMLSGYVAALKSEKSLKPLVFLRKKVISLVLPFFTWGGIILPFVISHYSYTEIPTLWFDLFVYIKSGAWFLIVLFAIQLYYLLVCLVGRCFPPRYKKIVELLAFVSILVLIYVSSLYSTYISNSTYFSFLFILSFATGVMMCRFFNRDLPKWVLFICFCLFVSNVSRFSFGVSPSWLRLLLGITGSLLVISAARSAEKNIECETCMKYRKLLVWFGENTIMIYLTHQVLIQIFKDYLIDVSHINPLPLFFICGIISMFITIIVIWVSKILIHIPYLSLLLYGKLSSN